VILFGFIVYYWHGYFYSYFPPFFFDNGKILSIIKTLRSHDDEDLLVQLDVFEDAMESDAQDAKELGIGIITCSLLSFFYVILCFYFIFDAQKKSLQLMKKILQRSSNSYAPAHSTPHTILPSSKPSNTFLISPPTLLLVLKFGKFTSVSTS
jgi:hypothetical protein